MNELLERKERVLTEAEKAQQHNDMINENFLKITSYAYSQFDVEEAQEEKAEEQVVEETPLYISPASVAKLEQTPRVTEYTAATAAVFTAQKFDNALQNAGASVAVQPEVYTAPVQAAKTVAEVHYALTPFAKMLMAAFTFVVIAMLTMICINTQIIRQKSVRIQNLEEKKQQLLEQTQEIQDRIKAAQSEETIRQYAVENGIFIPEN